ncbi:hypothetical protein DKX38_004504 [Salix brachista]|uniref:DNA-directed RNA polymerase n=1 Tax=Salix brachista TaxID=2182728 RepID=A0A5N5NA53_9ROSI|nr:hypothetical protein DKX38_004504 [Salix brachista]
MVDFRGVANKLSLQVVDCLKTSELNPDKSANIDPLTADQPKKSNDYVNNASGLRWIEDVVLGKRNDRSFRMVIVGDPNLHLHEIGIPCHIAERLQDSESLTAWNWEKLSACFENDLNLDPSANACVWTGKQLISLLRPVGFDHDFPSSDVCIRNVDLVYSEGSFWLRDTDAGSGEEDYCVLDFDGERMCYEKQRSATPSQSSVDAFKLVFRDIQSLISLQHALAFLSFRMPRQLSCAGWNKQIRAMLLLKVLFFQAGILRSVLQVEIVLSVTMIIFLGLNLFRRIMFFMRDLHGA